MQMNNKFFNFWKCSTNSLLCNREDLYGTSTIRYPLFSLKDQRAVEICKKQSEIVMRHLPAISIYGYVGGIQISRYGR